MGALVGGTTGAILNGASQWRHAQQPNRTPRFTFTSTRISQTPTGSTIRMTNNAGGRMRTTIIRTPHDATQFSPTDMSVIDHMILQMLMQNALNQGAHNVEQMSYEELLQRFGVGTEQRGASPEAIASLPLTTLDSPQAVESLD